MLHYFDKATGRKSKKPPQFAKKGQKIVALVETAQAVCVERFADYPQLGRFTLRDEGKTIAIGKVSNHIWVHVDELWLKSFVQITKLVESGLDEAAEAVAGVTV